MILGSLSSLSVLGNTLFDLVFSRSICVHQPLLSVHIPVPLPPFPGVKVHTMNNCTSLNWAEGDEALVYKYTPQGWAFKIDLELGWGVRWGGKGGGVVNMLLRAGL